MFSLKVRLESASLMSVILQPGYGWETFLDELGRLEWAALGDLSTASILRTDDLTGNIISNRKSLGMVPGSTQGGTFANRSR